MKGNKGFKIFLVFFLALCCVTTASAEDAIENVQFVTLHLHENGATIWLNGEINGVSKTDINVQLLFNHPNYNQIYATILTAKVMNLRARVDVDNVNTESRIVKAVVLW